MNFSGEYRIAAPRSKVWDAVNNAGILQQCIPGCEEIVQTTPTDWTVRVVTRVGPVRARFSGQLSLQDICAPEKCKIVGSGSGGTAGFANGSADIALDEREGLTVLRYDANTEIGGKLAQIGSRLIDSFVKQYADDFFLKFSALVEDDSTEPLAPRAGLKPEKPVDAGPATLATPDRGSPVFASAMPTALPPSSSPRPAWFDAQSFTILVLAALLVFMTITLTTRL